MNLDNVKIGLKKIFKAEILQLIGVPILFLGTIFALVGTALVSSDSVVGITSGILVFSAIAVIFVLAGSVLAIIAFIINIVGVTKLSNEDANFKSAFIFLGLGICFSLAAGITSCFGVATVVTSTIQNLISAFEILVIIYVIQGTMSIMAKVGGQEALIEKGRHTCMLITSVFIFSIIFNMFGNYLQQDSTTTLVSAIVLFISAVAEVIGYIWYLGILKKAIKVL